MNKLTVVSFGAIFVTTNLSITYFLSGYLMGNTSDRLQKQITQLSSDTNNNEKTLNKLLSKKTFKSENNKSQPEIVFVDTESNNSPSEDPRFDKLDTEIDSLKIQFKLFNEMTTASLDDLEDKVNVSLVSNQTVSNNTVIAQPVTMEMRMEASRIAAEKRESNYESVLFNDNDSAWSSEIEDTIGNLIDTDSIGNNIQLLGVKCSSELCKVNLLTTKNGLNDDTLLASLGNSTIYTNKYENSGTGQEETVMYVSRPGQKLPSFQ